MMYSNKKKTKWYFAPALMMCSFGMLNTIELNTIEHMIRSPVWGANPFLLHAVYFLLASALLCFVCLCFVGASKVTGNVRMRRQALLLFFFFLFSAIGNFCLIYGMVGGGA